MGNRKDLYKDIIIKPLSAFSEETEEKKEAFLVKLKLVQSISKDVFTYVNAKFEDVKNIFLNNLKPDSLKLISKPFDQRNF